MEDTVFKHEDSIVKGVEFRMISGVEEQSPDRSPEKSPAPHFSVRHEYSASTLSAAFHLNDNFFIPMG
jgi:hypothetical protein